MSTLRVRTEADGVMFDRFAVRGLPPFPLAGWRLVGLLVPVIAVGLVFLHGIGTAQPRC